MNQKKLLGIGSLVLALLSFGDTAFACKCAQRLTPCEAYEQAQAVFIGTAKELSWIEFEEKLEGVATMRKQPVISFSVVQAFRGVNDSQISVMTGGDDCGYEFKIGEQYLVYAFRDRQKKEMLSTSLCTRTRLIRNADVDLEYIRGLSKPSPGGWVFGSVFKANWASQRSLPIEGFEVTVEGQGKSVTVTTDSDGEFHASSLPEGNYKVRVAPPEGLSARINEFEVKVAYRRCATARFVLASDGRISGRILDAQGRPLSNCILLLYSVERSGFKTGADIDDEGRYERGPIPPGQYKLEVACAESHGDPLKAFPVFHYPGVLSADQAGVIDVGESAKVEGLDVHLPPLSKRRVEGVVLLPDGRPASNAQLTCRLRRPWIREAPVNVDKQGRFSFEVYEGMELTLDARMVIEKGKLMRAEMKAAEKGDLVGVKLILAPQTR